MVSAFVTSGKANAIGGSVSLLPFLNEALIKHQLRALRYAGIEHLHLDPAAEALREFFLGHHDEGITIRFQAPCRPGPLLVIEPDVLPGPALRDFVAEFQARNASAALAENAPGHLAGVWLISAGNHYGNLNRPPSPKKASFCYLLRDARRIKTVEDYLNATADLLNTCCGNYRKLADGVFVDDAAFISPLARLDGNILIGRNASIAEGVRLEGTVVLGEGVMLCRNALVRNSVIMAGAAVGSNARIVDSLIADCFTVGPGAVFNRCLAVERESDYQLGLSPGYHMVETSPRGPAEEPTRPPAGDKVRVFEKI